MPSEKQNKQNVTKKTGFARKKNVRSKRKRKERRKKSLRDGKL